MEKTIDVRGLRLGEGLPKICVSVMCAVAEDLPEEVQRIKKGPAELVEWRIDYLQNWEDRLYREKALALLRSSLGEIPLLFTFRSAQEGGQTPISLEKYHMLNLWAVESGQVDLVDVELRAGDALCKALLSATHSQGIKVVLSNHDFEKTPSVEELLESLRRMRALGGDIPKIAVMPQCPGDVITLLTATELFNREADTPFVTMSMGTLGGLSRVAGAFFGSAITFGAVGQGSAPGQLEAGELAHILQVLQGPRGPILEARCLCTEANGRTL